jgi:hypothetical protein
VSEESTAPRSSRWALAEQIAEAARRRFPADILAIGPLAHGDDTENGDVELIVVTFRPGVGPWPVTRRVDGTMVDLDVFGSDEYLRQARTLSTSSPLTADRYVTTKPLHDPTRWLDKLRDTHLGRLAQAREAEFATLAREAWYRGFSAHARAVRLAEGHQTEAALLMLGEARLATATVIGLLTRTYFRSNADAVIRTGIAGTDITELNEVLRNQAAELADRGRPVDSMVADFFGR